MSFTVDDIQSAVASVVDQDQDTSNISSDDYSLRLEYLNNRERTWAESGRYQVLYQEYLTNTSTSTGNVTVSLPSNYRTLAGFPRTFVGGTEYEFSVIEPQHTQQFASSERYAKVLGNPVSGYNLVFHPGTNSGQLASGATIFVSYFANPSSLASPANTVTCPNPNYLIQGVIADVWEAREDARFQIKQADAEQILSNMREYELTPSEADNNNRVKSVEETKYNYRWGRD